MQYKSYAIITIIMALLFFLGVGPTEEGSEITGELGGGVLEVNSGSFSCGGPYWRYRASDVVGKVGVKHKFKDLPVTLGG